MDMTKLQRAVEDRLRTPFAWSRDGGSDCVSFPLVVLGVASGRDLVAEMGLKDWSSAIGAARAMSVYAGKTRARISDAVMVAVGRGVLDPVERGFQRRGDLVLCEAGAGGDQRLMLVCSGSAGDMCGPGAQGLVWASLSEGDRVFRLSEAAHG